MRVTVFTPTYNRVTYLPDLYDSICAAFEKVRLHDEFSLEWIIVDDGSDVCVDDCVRRFSEKKNFEIKLISKENGGKHTAFNIAIDEANSDLFVCIDDDDRLTENSLSEVVGLAQEFNDGHHGAIVGRVVDESFTLLGKKRFDGILISNTIEIRDKYHFWGEPEFYYTAILKQYRFDIFPGERFLTEAYVFDEMSTVFPFVYTNVPMMIKKYLPGGLTDNQLKIRIESPVGSESYYYRRSKITRGFFARLKCSINRRRFARYILTPPKRELNIFELIAIPFAWVMSIKDRRNYSVKKV